MPKLKKSIPFKKLIWWGIGAAFLVCLPRIITTLIAQPYLRTVDDVQAHEYAIVLAAEVKEDGSPSLVLQHRVQRGVELYQAGKAEILIMSGRAIETTVMREYAISLGVDEGDIVLDNGGIRTYATCYDAVNFFELDGAIVVTQPFHTPRTLFLCRTMGLGTVAVPAIHGKYWRGSWLAWQIRETLATVLAFKETYITAPDTSEYIQLAEEGVSK
ncbi:MAG TPA: ElyC/SanA/YdcF family protein [Anaerolineales bacterium]|nr:ElyC/SanA/YdcF family protein [Anaerolineales bacterium]